MSEYTTEQMLQDRCKDIANELVAISDYRLYRDADGDTFEADDINEAEKKDPFATLVEMNEYLEDVYDVKATIDSNGRIESIRVAVALGGPNIYIDTDECAVCGCWGGDRAKSYLTRDVADEVEEALFCNFEGVTVSI